MADEQKMDEEQKNDNLDPNVPDSNGYPLTSQNNVKIKSGDDNVEKRTQDVTMLDTGSNTIFNFNQTIDGKKQSVMEVYKKDEQSYVKIEAPNGFVNQNGQSVLDNPELKAIFEGDGLLVGDHAIDVKKTGEEITVTIEGEDREPYFIRVRPEKISLEYGKDDKKQSFTYSALKENSSLINIDLERGTIENMLKSSSENNIFKPFSNVRSIPTNMMGLYFKGMQSNTALSLGKFNLTNCQFSNDIAPYCFVTQTKSGSKTQKETLLFENGAFVTCSNNMLSQYVEIDGKKQHNLVLGTANRTNPKYFAIPIDLEKGNATTQQFADAYTLMVDNTTLSPYGEELGKGAKINVQMRDGNTTYSVADITSFEKKDGREYTTHQFTIKPKNYEITRDVETESYFERSDNDISSVDDFEGQYQTQEYEVSDENTATMDGIVWGGNEQEHDETENTPSEEKEEENPVEDTPAPEEESEEAENDGGFASVGGDDGSADGSSDGSDGSVGGDGGSTTGGDSPAGDDGSGSTGGDSAGDSGSSAGSDGSTGGDGSTEDESEGDPAPDEKEEEPAPEEKEEKPAPEETNEKDDDTSAVDDLEGKYQTQEYEISDEDTSTMNGVVWGNNEQEHDEAEDDGSAGGASAEEEHEEAESEEMPAGESGDDGSSASGGSTSGGGSTAGSSAGAGAPAGGSPAGSSAGAGAPAGGGSPVGAGAPAGGGPTGTPVGSGSSAGGPTAGSSPAGIPAGGDGEAGDDENEDTAPADTTNHVASGNGGNRGTSQSTSQAQAPAPKKKKEHVNPYLVRKKEIEESAKEDKALLKAKNTAFKERLKALNTMMGDTLATGGFFLLIASMIPGVGLLTLIPGLIISGIGLFQSTFADKLVFDPYRKIKHKLKKYEDEQFEEIEYRDQFIENEHTLDKLNANSKEKISQLENLYGENSGNHVARDFAELYNENGVGFVRERGVSGTRQLSNIDNLANRTGMTSMLTRIQNERNANMRNQLINNFATAYFQDLDREKRQKLANMFAPENSEALRSFVSTLSKANDAQSREQNLLNSQREAIKNADMYRMKYLAGTDKFSDSQRLSFFERYGRDILSGNLLNQGSSSQVMDQIIQSVPERQQDAVTEILHKSVQNLQESNSAITGEAQDNVSRKRELNSLVNYTDIVNQIESNVDAVSLQDITNQTADYLYSYTLSYNHGYADKLKQGIVNDDLKDSTKIKPKYGTVKNNESVKINDMLNQSIAEISLGTTTSQRLADIQAQSIQSMEDSGMLREVAELYSGVQEDGTRILDGGSILPDPTKKESVKDHTVTAVADRIAKERLSYLVSSTDSTLEDTTGKSTQELLSYITIGAKPADGITVNGNVYDGADVASMWSTVRYAQAQESYKAEKRAVMSGFISGELVDTVTRKNSSEPMVQYDSSKKEYKVINYDTVLKEKSEDPDFYRFKHFDEAKTVEQFTKKYPFFKNLPAAKQQQFIMLKLGIDGHRERLEDEKEKAIKDGSFDKNSHDLQVALYDKLEKSADAVLSGQLSSALDEIAFDPIILKRANYDYSLSKLQTKGKNLDKSINGYVKFNGIVASLPLTEEEKKSIRDNAISMHERHNIPLSFALRQELVPYLQAKSIDGQTIEEIIDSYSTVNGETATVNRQAVVKYCENKSKVYDERSQKNIEMSRQALGQTFVSEQYKSRVADATNDRRHYSDYIEFFTENGYDEATRMSRLFPEQGEMTKEQHERLVSEEFAKTSTRRERNKLIEGFVTKLGCMEEYKQAKKNIAYKNPQSEEEKAYTKGVKRSSEFETACSKYYSDMSTLLAMPSLSIKNRRDRKTFATLINDKTFKTLGLDKDDIMSIIENNDLNNAQKRNAISMQLNRNEQAIAIKRAEYREEIAVADRARTGVTSEDRKALRAQTEAKIFSRGSKEMIAKLNAIKDFLQNNPDYLYGQELVNAFARGNGNFFLNHPEFDRQGLDFGNLDKRLIDKLGIKMDDLIDNPNRFNIKGKSAKQIAKIKKKATAKNKKILEKLIKFTNGQVKSLTKEEKKIYNDVEKKVKKATKAKSSAKTDLSQEKPTSLLTSLKLLARSFERRHEVSSARIREELERQMRESESSAEHSDDEAENS